MHAISMPAISLRGLGDNRADLGVNFATLFDLAKSELFQLGQTRVPSLGRARLVTRYVS